MKVVVTIGGNIGKVDMGDERFQKFTEKATYILRYVGCESAFGGPLFPVTGGSSRYLEKDEIVDERSTIWFCEVPPARVEWCKELLELLRKEHEQWGIGFMPIDPGCEKTYIGE